MSKNILEVVQAKNTQRIFRSLLRPHRCSLLATLLFIVNSPCYATTNMLLAEFIEATTLIELQQGSRLSDIALHQQNGEYETAQGDKVYFKKWYFTKWTDATATFLTQASNDFGIIWGLGTGERGEKYTIAPSFKLGLAYQHNITPHATIGIKATTLLGGNFHERSCTADYGEIGGVQEVNCRLAATTLEPSETLKYLIDKKPYNQTMLSIQYRAEF